VDEPLRNYFKGKRALVTGGMGFIGSNLASRLAQMGAEVSILDNLDPDQGGNPFNINGMEKQLMVVKGDLRDNSQLEPLLAGQDYLFHLAGQSSHMGSMQLPEEDLEINTLGSLRMLELCRKVNPGIRIIYTSTRQVYGRPEYLPVDEKHPLAPLDFNGVSKLAATMYHMVAWQVYGLKTTVLRLTNVYGPRMRVKDARLTFIGWWIRQILEGQALEVYGEGTQLRELNYVEDVVQALVLVAADPKTAGEVYNLGGEKSISVMELATMLVMINGKGTFKQVEYPTDRKRIEIGNYTCDFSKINSAVGWTPSVSLHDGLALTLNFYRENKAHYW
jgi:UDP-glucose 4-epimerase